VLSYTSNTTIAITANRMSLDEIQHSLSSYFITQVFTPNRTREVVLTLSDDDTDLVSFLMAVLEVQLRQELRCGTDAATVAAAASSSDGGGDGGGVGGDSGASSEALLLSALWTSHSDGASLFLRFIAGIAKS
jgi:hypothetical protein